MSLRCKLPPPPHNKTNTMHIHTHTHQKKKALSEPQITSKHKRKERNQDAHKGNRTATSSYSRKQDTNPMGQTKREGHKPHRGIRSAMHLAMNSSGKPPSGSQHASGRFGYEHVWRHTTALHHHVCFPWLRKMVAPCDAEVALLSR